MTEITPPSGLINGLTYSVPLDGVIRMGFAVKRGDGKRLPQKDDQFTITRKFKDASGSWAPHALDEVLRQEFGEDVGKGEKRLRRIPVRIAFDTPNLSISEQFAVFNTDGRPMCVGNGCKAKRRDVATGDVDEVDCPGPDGCQFGLTNRCDAFVRLIVQIDHKDASGQHFILRSGSVNAVTDCRTVLESLSRMFKGLSGLPMWLTLEAKSSSQSRQSVFWYASLRPRFGELFDGAQIIQSRRQREAEVGMDREAYEATLVALRNNGFFAETGEDAEQMEDLLVARFSEISDDGPHSVKIASPRPSPAALGEAVASVTERLTRQAEAAKGRAAVPDGEALAQVAVLPATPASGVSSLPH